MKNKLESQVLIVIGGEVFGTSMNWGHAKEEVESWLQENPKDFEKPIQFYNVVNAITTEFHFRVETKKGGIYFDNMQEYSDGEVEFSIQSGYWSGKSFDDEDTMKEFIKDKFEAGELTIDDIREMEINQERNNTVQFSEAWQDSDVFTIELNNGTASDIVDTFGEDFILADNAPVAVVAEQRTERKHIDEMTDQELEAKIGVLQDRIFAMQMELRVRKSTEGNERVPADIPTTIE